MKIPLVKVGNSRGIRIPKVIIEECKLGSEVNLEIKDRSIVISSTDTVRSGWSESFLKMSEMNDDKLIESETTDDWDNEEWEWK